MDAIWTPLIIKTVRRKWIHPSGSVIPARTSRDDQAKREREGRVKKLRGGGGVGGVTHRKKREMNVKRKRDEGTKKTGEKK